MTHKEIMAFLYVAIALLIVGTSLLFGAWALIGCGIVLLVLVTFAKERKELNSG